MKLFNKTFRIIYCNHKNLKAMKTELNYQKNFEGNTLWVTNQEFRNMGSFIRTNGSGLTYTACLDGIMLGKRFRSLYSAMIAMQKQADKVLN